MLVLWVLLYFVYACCRTACFVPWVLLLQVLHMLVPQILLHCFSRHGYFLHTLHFCASLIYVIINNGAANDIIISSMVIGSQLHIGLIYKLLLYVMYYDDLLLLRVISLELLILLFLICGKSMGKLGAVNCLIVYIISNSSSLH